MECIANGKRRVVATTCNYCDTIIPHHLYYHGCINPLNKSQDPSVYRNFRDVFDFVKYLNDLVIKGIEVLIVRKTDIVTLYRPYDMDIDYYKLLRSAPLIYDSPEIFYMKNCV